MVGMTPSPKWLSSEFLLSQFSKQRKTAIRRYRQFVSEGLKSSSIWHQLSNQVYLGDKAFVDRVQKYLPNDNGDIQIPKIQRRPVVRSLAEYESESDSRNSAIQAAYASGAYSWLLWDIQSRPDPFKRYRFFFKGVGRLLWDTHLPVDRDQSCRYSRDFRQIQQYVRWNRDVYCVFRDIFDFRRYLPVANLNVPIYG